MSALLPPNASRLERALAQVIERLLAGAPIPIRALRDPETCPAAWLPWLAWERHVDTWRADWPIEARRAAVADSYRRHRLAGTRAGDDLLLEAAGAVYDLVENPGGVRHTVSVAIRNSQDLLLGADDIRRALEAVGRASVRYTVSAVAGISSALPVAVSAAARAAAPLLSTPPLALGGGGRIVARA